MSKIATDTAANLLAMFAGQTVTLDALFDTVEQQYTFARKRTGMDSYAQILVAIERAGAVSNSGSYTFPAAQAVAS